MLHSSGTWRSFEAFSPLGELKRESVEARPPTDCDAILRLTAEVILVEGACDLSVVLDGPPLSIPRSEIV